MQDYRFYFLLFFQLLKHKQSSLEDDISCVGFFSFKPKIPLVLTILLYQNLDLMVTKVFWFYNFINLKPNEVDYYVWQLLYFVEH